ncbi:uncharacterized protein [Argopecten irradians]|uniref:uncharacterized protein n=1 Tax=Argopecten irradians TaxID=31199 RepID=UPI00371512EC
MYTSRNIQMSVFSVNTVRHQPETVPSIKTVSQRNSTTSATKNIISQNGTMLVVKDPFKKNETLASGKDSSLHIVPKITSKTAVKKTMAETCVNPIKTFPLKGYIVYECDNEHPGGCGGWSDRMSGMYSAYVISVILSKHFLIKYTISGKLTDYLSPNSLDWRYNSSLLEGRSWGYTNLIIKTPKEIRECSITGLRSMFSKDVNFVRINWDYTQYFRKFPGLHSVIPWLFELHYADIYSTFFHKFFKPTKLITKAVNGIVKNAKKLACAHIRMGGSKTIPGDDKHTDKSQLKFIWDLLKRFENRNYSIFIATDAQFVRDRAKELFPLLIEVEGRIIHIDWKTTGGNLDEGYRKVVVDFFVLAKCDVLMLTLSGFGIMSAYLNTNATEMYCLTKQELVPCSRYTIHNYFPGPLLAHK